MIRPTKVFLFLYTVQLGAQENALYGLLPEWNAGDGDSYLYCPPSFRHEMENKKYWTVIQGRPL